MTATPHGTATPAPTATITVTINRARHALLTAVSWADPAGLGLPLALAQSQADQTGKAGQPGQPGQDGNADQTAARAPEVRASTSKGRAARRRRSAVRG
ncbi:hypothetical protein [Streptomyces sp. NBC_01180]|uniref:hypothetical protein n=1 Tax=Streptomyces sp. NBC_01180 TaxID=2903763 RepID=UPI0038697BED|nr:hypothetical protein OG708_16710 [Streptomyces sp. NBC_01180]